MVEQIDDEHPLREPLQIIEREALRGRGIVQNLLDFSRQSEPSLAPTDLCEVLDETLARLSHRISQQRAQVEATYSRDLPAVMADSQQLHQVFTNIILNAVQAMPDGGKLSIASRVDDMQIQIAISDTGVGIAPENLPRIFDPFFTTKEVGQGTGLGLSVSFSIIKQHQGTIEVESAIGGGSCFTVKLPVY